MKPMSPETRRFAIITALENLIMFGSEFRRPVARVQLRNMLGIQESISIPKLLKHSEAEKALLLRRLNHGS